METTTTPSVESTAPAPVQVPQYRLPDVGVLLRTTWSFYRANLELILKISAIAFVCSAAGIFLEKSQPVLFVIVTLMALLIGFLTQIALAATVVDEEKEVGHAFTRARSLFTPYAWMSFLIMLAVLGGVFLFILPGIIVAILLSFTIFVLLVEGVKGFPALSKSWYYGKGFVGAILWRLIVLGVGLLIIRSILIAVADPGSIMADSERELSLIGKFVDLSFASFVATPLGVIFSFYIYKALRLIKVAESVELEESTRKRNLKLFISFGVFGLVALLAVAVYFTMIIASIFSFNIAEYASMASVILSSTAELLPAGI
jgi:hypothetical protein